MASAAQKPVTGSYFKECWDEKNFHAEIFFPKELVISFPWGECKPQSSFEFKTIYKVSHITHKKTFREITAGAGQYYTFKPSRKFGKCGYSVTDGSPLGESYRCDLRRKAPTEKTRYSPISREDLVLPEGYYLWWGTSDARSSLYGTEKLTINFKSLLRKFQYLQKAEVCLPDVYLRVGGTLRYRKEICFVIVVHTADETTPELEQLPPLRESSHFKLEGFLDPRGRIVDWDKYPSFASNKYDGESYDRFAFAFYFNDDYLPLTLDKAKIRTSTVRHEHCLRSIKIKSEYRPTYSKSWYCPEDPEIEKLLRKKNLKLEDVTEEE